ncbi:hypothetical protein ASPFODRAFT_430710 [Aspergillus luchuensis CBS 106.47]|uniref:Uncharacterized protein n=1 Tax=Aspergillus luchuensis (strain CBS 106.47) TaxID=1137211 RepID=A0A1M3TUW7_ASPLC|nr:hypothetical protein ASPFODRAFT_430710 [Aspergillus luchuensis CBS 106.47]
MAMSDHNKANKRTNSRLGKGKRAKKKKAHPHRSVIIIIIVSSPSQKIFLVQSHPVPARPTGSTDSLLLWGIAPYDDIAVSLSCHRRPSFRSFSFFSRPHSESVFLVWLVWLLSRPGVDTIAGYFPSQDSASANHSHGRPLEAWKKFRMLLRRF